MSDYTMSDYTNIINAIQSGNQEEADTLIRVDLETRAMDYLSKYNPATDLSDDEDNQE
jgi:DNA-binding FadR family transcriptional regulator